MPLLDKHKRHLPPGWFGLGYLAFGIAFWIGLALGIHALTTVL